MPLVAMITDAMIKVKALTPQISTVHLSHSTIEEAKCAVFIFTSPESILNGCGRLLLQTASVASRIKAVFVDEFHIVSSW